MAVPLVLGGGAAAAAIPIIARVATAALPTIGRMAAGSAAKGVAGAAGRAIGGGNRGNEGEPRRANFDAGAGAVDPLSSRWLNAPQW